MSSRDNISNSQLVFLGTLTLSGTTPAASNWVDTIGFDSASLIVKTNTVTAAGTTGFSFVMQESDTTDASDATAVASGEILGALSDLTVVSNDDDNIIKGAVGYVGDARYVRLNATGTTNTNAAVDVYAKLDHPHRAETTFVGTSVAAT
jgi:hypothetical protein